MSEKIARWTRGESESVEGLLHDAAAADEAAAHTESVVGGTGAALRHRGVASRLRAVSEPAVRLQPLSIAEFRADRGRGCRPRRGARLDLEETTDLFAYPDRFPAEWKAFRRARLTALVARLRTALHSSRPSAVFTAAVVPDQQDAFDERMQDWRVWLSTRLVDAVAPMAYTQEPARFAEQIAAARDIAGGAAVWAGIGSYRLSPAQTFENIQAARKLGAAGFVLFSYDSLTGPKAAGARLSRDRQPRRLRDARSTDHARDNRRCGCGGLRHRTRDRHAGVPPAAIEVARQRRAWRNAFGTLTYAADAPAATDATVFDLVADQGHRTTTRAMQAIDAGRLELETASRIVYTLARSRSEAVSSPTCSSTHRADRLPSIFRDHHGRVEFERAICTMPLEYAPRTQSIYSDLGFMLLGFILEDVGSPLEDFCASRTSRFRLQAEDLRFNPPKEWRERIAPTELVCGADVLIHGEVHDENTWSLGGVAGTRGCLGRRIVGVFARRRSGFRGAATFARAETFARFARKSRVPGSSRALGWNRCSRPHRAAHACAARSATRGFTGTSLWIDPGMDLYVIVLTNRVHPSRDNNAISP